MRSLNDLDAVEERVLGALMEKQETTPDYYPLTIKALVSACNQKTNREPVMELGEMDVLNTLRVLQQDDWAERISGARVQRWGHLAESRLGANRSRLALLTLLLLRGAQTSAKTVLRWYPRGNCILAQPDRDVAAAPEATLVLPPVPDSVLLLVLAVDSARLRCDHDVTPRSL